MDFSRHAKKIRALRVTAYSSVDPPVCAPPLEPVPGITKPSNSWWSPGGEEGEGSLDRCIIFTDLILAGFAFNNRVLEEEELCC